MEKVFFIIPSYNDYHQLPSITQEIIQKKFNCVIIDDGSTISQPALPVMNGVYFLRHKENLGQGAALQTGFEFALLQGATVLVSFDADGQHRLEDAINMIDLLLQQNVDIVLGSRFLNEESMGQIPKSRRFLLQLARSFNNLMTGLYLTDAHNGLRVLRGEKVHLLKITQNRMAHATEIIYLVKKHKLRYQEFSTNIIYTEANHKTRGTLYIARIIGDLLYAKIYKSKYIFEIGFFFLMSLFTFLFFSLSIQFIALSLLAFLLLMMALFYRRKRSRLLKKTCFIREQAIKNVYKL